VRGGGEEYGYRLRISAARPDFALRTVPSSITLRAKSGGGSISVYVQRKDGCTAPITITLKNPPAGVSCKPVTLIGMHREGQRKLQGGEEFEGGYHGIIVFVVGFDRSRYAAWLSEWRSISFVVVEE